MTRQNTDKAVLNRQEPVDKHRIPKSIFDQLDGIHKLVAETLIAKGEWELV